MSGNTNTLFWVICGAVIILAIFTLVQTNNTSTLSTMFDSQASKFNDLVAVKPNYPLTKGNWNVDIGPVSGRITIYAKNISTETLRLIGLYVKFYDCKTKETITTINKIIIMDIEAGSRLSSSDVIPTSAANKLKQTVFCIDFSI